MSLKFSRPVKIAVIVLAVIGLLAIVGAIVLFVAVRNESRNGSSDNADDNTRFISNYFAGTPTALGLVTRYVSNEGNRTTVAHHLLKVIKTSVSQDGKYQVVLVEYHEISNDISAKIESGSIDIVKFAAAGTQDMLLSKPDNNGWSAMALLMQKQSDGGWSVINADDNQRLPGDFSGDPADLDFPPLTSKVVAFSIKDSDGALGYYVQTGKMLNQALSVQPDVNDLDDCLAERKATEEKAARRKEAARTQSSPASAESAPQAAESAVAEEEGEDEEDARWHPDYVCAQAKATTKVLQSGVQGVQDLEVTVTGQGPAKAMQTRRYVLRFSQQKKRYLSADLKNSEDPLLDFVSRL